jgi:hypothetical protein
MKLGIMQPYFFPYLGYFELIRRTDEWIVFDTAQYIRHGWVNRNRVLHPKSGAQYIKVPIKHCVRETPIKEIEIADRDELRPRILGQIEHYKKRAPYYRETTALVDECLSGDEISLSRLNVSILDRLCRHLDIPFRCRVFSEMQLPLGPVEGPGDWALRISEALGAGEYVNPPGGVDLFDPRKFAASGIRLTLQKLIDFTYECRGYEFEPYLSIIDVLMWNPCEKVKEFLATWASEREGKAETAAADGAS